MFNERKKSLDSHRSVKTVHTEATVRTQLTVRTEVNPKSESGESGDPLTDLNTDFEDMQPSLQRQPKNTLHSAYPKSIASPPQLPHVDSPILRKWVVIVEAHFIFRVSSAINIICHSVLIGVLVSSPPGSMHQIQDIIDFCFLPLLSIEVLIRFLAETSDQFGHRGLLMMDIFILLALVLEFLLRVLGASIGEDMTWLSKLVVVRWVRLMDLAFISMRPKIIIHRTIMQAGGNILTVFVFLGILLLALSIVFTAFIGRLIRLDSKNIREQRAVDNFSTVSRSFLFFLEVTAGGVQWMLQVVRPMLRSELIEVKLVGVAVLISTLMSSMWISNLLLGSFICQVVSTAQDYDQDQEMQSFSKAEDTISMLNRILEECDTNGDGLITKEELGQCITNSKNNLENKLSEIGLTSKDIVGLHAAQDIDRSGLVSIKELIFAVLRLNGSSKTIDMLSVDYQQKTFLRDIALLDTWNSQSVNDLSADIESVHCTLQGLVKGIDKVHMQIDEAKSKLLREINRARPKVEDQQRKAHELKLLRNAKRDRRAAAAHEALKTHLTRLRLEVAELLRDEQLETLMRGNPETVEALNRLVRKRLNSKLKPWLENQLMYTRSDIADWTSIVPNVTTSQ